jgi:tetratricopeptide (TPR) repeat protein
MVAIGPVAAQDTSSRGTAGAFLSARIAVTENNFSRIAANHDRLLQSDPDNIGFLELSMQGHLLSGNFERAAERAAQILARDGTSSTANLVLQADAFQRGAYDVVLSALDARRMTGPLTDPMANAWAQLGRGSMSEAIAAFDEVIADREELAPFALYFKALAFALVGDLERAETLLTGEAEGPIGLTRRGVIAHVAILSQLGRMEDAIALTDAMFGTNPDEDVAYLRAALQEGRAVPFETITSARDGMAETYYMLASALPTERDDWLPLVYARLALALRPEHADAILLTGQLLERAGQFGLADAVYDTMPRDHPQYLGAQLGKANALASSGEIAAAIDNLRALSQTKPDSVLVHSALGDLLRREEQFAEAEAAYASALALLDTIEDRHWVLIYTRAITLERLGDWERAEPEFRRALDIVPDEPQVLNYLGYSLIDKGVKLDEALDMIERAVEAEPDSGFIVDSLGWAFYRLGRYEEALPVMERAVELVPTDPILNDHLGDVYWAVGREREARFQWRRALSFAPHPDLDVDRVQHKIRNGKTPPDALTDTQ